jgi:hypothetical protein
VCVLQCVGFPSARATHSLTTGARGPTTRFTFALAGPGEKRALPGLARSFVPAFYCRRPRPSGRDHPLLASLLAPVEVTRAADFSTLAAVERAPGALFPTPAEEISSRAQFFPTPAAVLPARAPVDLARAAVFSTPAQVYMRTTPVDMRVTAVQMGRAAVETPPAPRQLLLGALQIPLRPAQMLSSFPRAHLTSTELGAPTGKSRPAGPPATPGRLSGRGIRNDLRCTQTKKFPAAQTAAGVSGCSGSITKLP